MKPAGICQICLRTDKVLKEVDPKLFDFHDELCDFLLGSCCPQYCMDCAYLLRKLYNFKLKCQNAVKVFKNWMKTKVADRKPAHLLHELLPPSSMGPWIPSNSKVYSVTYHDHGPTLSVDTQSQDPVSSVVKFINNTLLHEEDQLKKESIASDSVDVNPLEETLIDVSYSNNGEEVDHLLLDEDGIKIEDNVTDFNDKADTANDTRNKSLKIYDSSVLRDHCYVKNEDEKSGGPIKKSITELVNNTFSDDDLEYDVVEEYLTEQSTDYSDDDTKKSRIKEKIVDKGTVAKKSMIKKKIVDKGTVAKKRMTAKNESETKREEDVDVELTNITLDEDCVNMRQKRLEFSRERFLSILQMKFEICGVLKAKDGTVINKKLILKYFNEKVNIFSMNFLWSSITGEEKIGPRALRYIEKMENKYNAVSQYETTFDIDYLNTEEKMMEEFQKRKTYECYLKAEYRCEICYLIFKNEKLLVYHNKLHEENAGGFVCPICSIRQKRKKLANNHLYSHEAVYKCKLCPLVTYYKHTIGDHYLWHKGVQFRCEPCDITYKSHSAYRTHVSLRHGLRREHACTACGRGFVSAAWLRWHIARGHQDEPACKSDGSSVRCEACDLTFPSADVYQRHLSVAHEPPATRGRRNNEKVLKVRKERKEPKPGLIVRAPRMTCQVCNAVGISYGWLECHYRMEHPDSDFSSVFAHKRTNLCHVCGKGYASKFALRDHMFIHTGVRPFACDMCPKRFRCSTSLKTHRATHLPPTYVCSHCGKQFRSPSNLYCHTKIHTGKRCYKCSICGKGFVIRSALNEHIRGVHHHVRRVKKKVTDTEVTDTEVTDTKVTDKKVTRMLKKKKA